MCAKLLREEVESYDFHLDNSYNAASDLKASYDMYRLRKPLAWQKCFDSMFPKRKNYDGLQRKCDAVFQIMYSLIQKKKTPLQVLIAETIHDASRSKKVITLLNRLGLSISYDEMMRIDTRLAERIIQEAGEFRVPVGPSIKSGFTIHGAMDNFDHEGGTLSGKFGSHDTILMLFQNIESEISTSNDDDSYICMIPEDQSSTKNERSLKHILPCQILSKATNIGKRGEIPGDFTPATELVDLTKETSRNQFLIWSASRSLPSTQSDSNQVPSFTATNSFFQNTTTVLTSFAFTPIIPYPATEYDTIFTCMKNFQDVLQQRDLDYGPLWSDEGVYWIAKEIQLLNPTLFSNIFLGLGGFHMEKKLIACCSAYLQDCGIESVFVENEIFGSGVVQSVLSGGHYIRGRKGMMMLAETLQHLQFQEYLRSNPVRLEDSHYMKAFQIMLQRMLLQICYRYRPKKLRLHMVGNCYISLERNHWGNKCYTWQNCFLLDV